MLKINTSKKLVILFFLLGNIFFNSYVMAALSTGKSGQVKNTNNSIKYVKAQVVVKFKDSLNQSASGLFYKSQSFATAGAPSLDKIALKYHFKKIEPVFRRFDEEKQSLAKTDVLTVKEMADQEFHKIIKQSSRSLRKAAPASKNNSTQSSLYHVYIIDIDPSMSVDDVVEELRKDSNVEYAQPNFINTYHLTPNDFYWTSIDPVNNLWGLKKIQADNAWNISQGEGITVAVIDTGVDYNHLDIKNNMWVNTQEIPNNGKDDDHNTYIDDVKGWDFTKCKEYGDLVESVWGDFYPCIIEGGEDNDPMDGSGHGTHVAGIIAAEGNNNLGIIGIAPKSKIMPIKALEDDGTGTETNLAKAIVYAVNNGADVINNSWGCYLCTYQPVLMDAIREALNRDKIVIFAAGNDAAHVQNYDAATLQRAARVISVASFDQNDRKANFSNFGESITIAAPGVQILSLNSRQGNNLIAQRVPERIVDKEYLRLSGTSMAAPYVAGLTALILSKKPNMSDITLKNHLFVTAEDFSNTDHLFNYIRRIDAYKALVLPEEDLISIIDFPENGNQISAYGDAVWGTASGKHFRGYQLFFGEMNKDGDLLKGIENQPISGGFIGYLPENLPTGTYSLRLRVNDLSGNYKDYTKKVFIEQKPKDASIFGHWLSFDHNLQEKWIARNHNLIAGFSETGDLIYDLSITKPDDSDQMIQLGDNQALVDITYDSIAYKMSQENKIHVKRVFDSKDDYSFSVDPGKGRVKKVINTYKRIFVLIDDQQSQRILIFNRDSVVPNKILDFSGVREIDANDESLMLLYEHQINNINLSTFEEKVIDSDVVAAYSDLKVSDDGLLVYARKDKDLNKRLFLYDIVKKQKIQVSSEKSRNPSNPDVHGNIVVWEDSRYGNKDIYMFNRVKNQEVALTAHFSEQKSPIVYNGLISWIDTRSSFERYGFCYLYDSMFNSSRMPVWVNFPSEIFLQQGKINERTFQLENFSLYKKEIRVLKNTLYNGWLKTYKHRLFLRQSGLKLGKYDIELLSFHGELSDFENKYVNIIPSSIQFSSGVLPVQFVVLNQSSTLSVNLVNRSKNEIITNAQLVVKSRRVYNNQVVNFNNEVIKIPELNLNQKWVYEKTFLFNDLGEYIFDYSINLNGKEIDRLPSRRFYVKELRSGIIYGKIMDQVSKGEYLDFIDIILRDINSGIEKKIDAHWGGEEFVFPYIAPGTYDLIIKRDNLLLYQKRVNVIAGLSSSVSVNINVNDR